MEPPLSSSSSSFSHQNTYIPWLHHINIPIIIINESDVSRISLAHSNNLTRHMSFTNQGRKLAKSNYASILQTKNIMGMQVRAPERKKDEKLCVHLKRKQKFLPDKDPSNHIYSSHLFPLFNSPFPYFDGIWWCGDMGRMYLCLCILCIYNSMEYMQTGIHSLHQLEWYEKGRNLVVHLELIFIHPSIQLLLQKKKKREAFLRYVCLDALSWCMLSPRVFFVFLHRWKIRSIFFIVI